MRWTFGIMQHCRPNAFNVFAFALAGWVFSQEQGPGTQQDLPKIKLPPLLAARGKM